MVLKLYGVMASQPVRAVAFVLALKGIGFELVNVMPGGSNEAQGRKPVGSRAPSFVAKVPPGTVPALEDSDAGVTLWESNAILTYVADKYKMEDIYPKDLVKRAQINQWLHWHHSNSRTFTMAHFAPILRPDIKWAPGELDAKAKQVKAVAKIMERQLQQSAFLAGNSLSLADIVCYEDMGQCRLEHLDLFDFAPYPALVRWMNAIEALPKFKESHKIFSKLRPIIDQAKNRTTASSKL